MPFTTETGRAARQRWQELYGGTELHRQWCALGYFELAAKLGSYEKANLKLFGIHYSKATYRKLKKTGYYQPMMWRVK